MTQTLVRWLLVVLSWVIPQWQPSMSQHTQRAAQEATMTPQDTVSEILLAKYRGNNARVEELLRTRPTLTVFEAAATGQTTRVRELIAANPALLNAYAPDGFHPLGLAAFFGNAPTVEALLQAGANVNQQSRESMNVSALHSSAAARRPDIAQLLLAHGAHPNLRGQGGVTVFHEVAATGQLDLAEMLLKHGGDLNAPDDAGKTPLGYAVAKKKDAMIAWLIERGAR
jgi:ankyrin repeat protein